MGLQALLTQEERKLSAPLLPTKTSPADSRKSSSTALQGRLQEHRALCFNPASRGLTTSSAPEAPQYWGNAHPEHQVALLLCRRAERPVRGLQLTCTPPAHTFLFLFPSSSRQRVLEQWKCLWLSPKCSQMLQPLLQAVLGRQHPAGGGSILHKRCPCPVLFLR